MNIDNEKHERQVRLLIRLDANDDPNRQDFLMQLAERNLLRGPLALVDILGKSYGTLISMPAATLNLLLVGDPAADKVLPDARTRRNIGFGKNARICPKCVALRVSQHPHFNFSLPIPCRLHKMMPIDECPRCDMPLTYVRRCVNYCNCGFNLAASPCIAVPTWLPKFSSIFGPWTHAIPGYASYEELAEHCGRTGVVVRMFFPESPNNLKTAAPLSWVTLRELLAMEKFVLDWPKSFQEFVASLENEKTSSRRKAMCRALLRSGSWPLRVEAEAIVRRIIAH